MTAARVLEGTRNRAEGRVMEDDLHSSARFSAKVKIADIAFVQPKPFPGLRSNDRFYLFKIVLVTSGKIIESDDSLIELEQRLEQVRADETGDAGDQPR